MPEPAPNSVTVVPYPELGPGRLYFNHRTGNGIFAVPPNGDIPGYSYVLQLNSHGKLIATQTLGPTAELPPWWKRRRTLDFPAFDNKPVAARSVSGPAIKLGKTANEARSLRLMRPTQSFWQQELLGSVESAKLFPNPIPLRLCGLFVTEAPIRGIPIELALTGEFYRPGAENFRVFIRTGGAPWTELSAKYLNPDLHDLLNHKFEVYYDNHQMRVILPKHGLNGQQAALEFYSLKGDPSTPLERIKIHRPESSISAVNTKNFTVNEGVATSPPQTIRTSELTVKNSLLSLKNLRANVNMVALYSTFQFTMKALGIVGFTIGIAKELELLWNNPTFRQGLKGTANIALGYKAGVALGTIGSAVALGAGAGPVTLAIVVAAFAAGGAYLGYKGSQALSRIIFGEEN